MRNGTKPHGGPHTQELDRLRLERDEIIDAMELFAAKVEFGLMALQAAFDVLRESVNKAKAKRGKQ